MALSATYPPQRGPPAYGGAADIDDEDKAWEQERPYWHQHIPDQPQRLGVFSVVCIISNRMIGSGIFLTPTTLVKYTQSLGITLLFWLAGAITTMCGILMFMEYGLTSPRFRLGSNRHKTPIPRSGGELYYLKEIIARPAFLAVCLYGIAFVLLGNVATNSMSFGVRVLQAAGRTAPVSQWSTADSWIARGIALLAVTFTCGIHAGWRLGGIYLNNVFAIVKLSMLLFIFITGCLTWGGVFRRSPDAANNLNSTVAFENPSKDAYAFAEAYLAVVFAFGASTKQTTYVMGEIDEPRRSYKWPAFFTVAGVSTLYLLVNVAYMLVVPAVDQKSETADVATTFFKLTYGSLGTSGSESATRLLYAFIAISSLGNIIVMTFTASKVKQEIAKEGILPFRTFFARSWRMPGLPLSKLFCRPHNRYHEEVPLGALLLHWVISVALIIFTCPLDPLQAYRILVSLYSYAIDAIPGVILAVGIFYLRANPVLNWDQDSFLAGGVSVAAALIYGLSMLFPVITSWVPPSQSLLQTLTYPWFTTPTVSFCVIALGFLYWLGFYYVYPLRYRNKMLLVRRTMYLNESDIMYHEKYKFDWTVREEGDQNVREEVTMGNQTADPDY